MSLYLYLYIYRSIYLNLRSMSRASSLSSEFGHAEDLIVTPFAQVTCYIQISISIISTTCGYQYIYKRYLLQILASLRTVRSNYVHLTNLPTRFIHCRISFSQINISFVIEGTEMKEHLQENQKSIKNPTPPSTRPAFQVQREHGRAKLKVVRRV